MTANIEFLPESWDKAAGAFDDTISGFISEASGVIGAMDVASMGAADSHGTVADAAFSIVFPVAFQAMTETLNGLSAGFTATAGGMRDTGDAYRGIEQRNADESTSIGVE